MLTVAAAVNILITFALIALGTIVHSENMALECVSWPICYQSKSQLVSTGYPMIHRFLAFIVIVINGALIFATKKNPSVDPESRKKLKVGMMLLILQSALGALSVFYKFPTIMSVAHLFLSVAYILVFSHYLFPKEGAIVEAKSYRPYAKDILSFIVFLVFIQFFLGGVLNHTTPREICGIGESASFICNEAVFGLSWWPTTLAAKVHMSHRFVGSAAYALILIFLLYTFPILREIEGTTKKTLRNLLLGLGIISALHVFATSTLLTHVESTVALVLHLTYGILVLVFSFAFLKWFNLTELKSFGQRVPTTAGDLFSLTKPRLGLLVIVTVVSGILLTGKFVDFFYLIFALVLTTMIVMSATTLNCYIEKEVDSKMERTKDRALPAGRLKASYALIQGILLIGISIPLTIKYVNLDTAILGLIAWAIYLFAYTPLKRKSPTALYVGAIPGAIPPVMGRTIVVGEIDAFGWILFAILFVWQLPHFMAISIYHNDDYKSGGIVVYSHVLSKNILKILMNILTIILIVCSVLPFYYGLSDKNYLYVSLALGIAFLAQCAYGFFVKDEDRYIAWARQYFWGSIIYLPLLMAAMIFLS